MKKENYEQDSYVVKVDDIKSRIGFSKYDEYRLSPKKTIHRVHVLDTDSEQAHMKRIPDVFLCAGAAVGKNREGAVAHFWPDRDLEFLGFLIAQGDDRAVAVKVRGAVVLNLPGARAGDKVYCSGPDNFSLCETPGAALIGCVKYVQADKAAVCFKRSSDARPLNLKY